MAALSAALMAVATFAAGASAQMPPPGSAQARSYNQPIQNGWASGGLVQNEDNMYSGPYSMVTVSGSSITFPVIGDIGRQGGTQSINNGNPGCPVAAGANAQPGVYYHGYPAVNFTTNDVFGTTKMGDYTLGSYQGGLVASMLNSACAAAGAAGATCTAVLNTGDNFYECGADDMFNPGLPTRLQTDFLNFYQTPQLPYILNVPWYSVIGNHDVPTPGGVDLQIAYSDMTTLWNFPARYYSVDFVATGVSVRYIALNTNPCVGSYLGPTNLRYGLSEELALTARALRATPQPTHACPCIFVAPS